MAFTHRATTRPVVAVAPKKRAPEPDPHRDRRDTLYRRGLISETEAPNRAHAGPCFLCKDYVDLGTGAALRFSGEDWVLVCSGCVNRVAAEQEEERAAEKEAARLAALPPPVPPSQALDIEVIHECNRKVEQNEGDV